LDNGWNSELAVKNIQRVLDTLGIELFTHVLDWEEFKDLQLAFLKASTPDCEIPTDHAIEAVLRRTALDHGVRYIVGGSNFATECIMPVSWSTGIRDWKYIRSIHRRFGKVPLKTFPHISIAGHLYYQAVRRQQMVMMLNYVCFNKDEAMRVLVDELGWQYYGGKHYESIYTRFFQSYILPRKFNYDKRRAHLSTLICSGQLNRDDALLEMANESCEPAMMDSDRRYVIKKLGITDGTFDEIMNAPRKRFQDYPSYERSVLFRAMKTMYARRRNNRS
jgi:DUF971 family protein